MLVIPPGLSEEEEALQKKFNKLKKKVRDCVWTWPNLSQTVHSEKIWGECERMGKFFWPVSRDISPTSQCSFERWAFPSPGVDLLSFLCNRPWDCLPFQWLLVPPKG